jgi:polysaccharide transporter, PST family
MNALWVRYLPAVLRARVVDRHRLQVLVGNGGWLLADKSLRGCVNLGIGVWMARHLGPETFGELNFAMAFVALFSAIVTLGLDGIVVRELVRQPGSKNEILGAAFQLKLLGAGVAFLVAVASIWQVRPGDAQSHWLVGIIAAGMVFQAIDVADLWFQSQVQSRATVIPKNIAFLVLAVVKVWLIVVGAELTAFAWAATGEIALGSIGLLFAFQATGNTWTSLRPTKRRMISLLSESWPQIFAGLAIMLYSRIDQVMLAQMLGNREVGLYSAAIRLSEIWNFIPSIIVSSVMPSLTEYRLRSSNLYTQRLQQLYTLVARVAYMVAIPISLFASPLVRLVYGDSYGYSGLVLAVHIWSCMFVFLGVATTPWTINEGKMRVALYQTILGAICNIVLNLYLIPLYGALGCALATTLSYGFCAWLLNSCFVETRDVFRMQTRSLFAAFRI